MIGCEVKLTVISGNPLDVRVDSTDLEGIFFFPQHFRYVCLEAVCLVE